MIEAWVIALRAVQYMAAAVVFGLPAFLIYSARATGVLSLTWPRPVLIWAAVVLSVAAPVALVAQTAVMSGSWAEAIRPETLGMMITGTELGLALVVRPGLAAAAVIALVLMSPGPRLWWITAVLGLAISASFAWTGHGAATEGSGHGLHLVADVIHAVAASLWIGALAAFVGLIVWRPGEASAHDRALASSLAGFAGVGTVAVGALVVTGLVNGAFLIGSAGLQAGPQSAYGLLLIVKVALFGAMAVLASANRYQHTPALETALETEDPAQLSVLADLRRSLAIEFGLSIAVLIVVAVMGTLPPPSSLS